MIYISGWQKKVEKNTNWHDWFAWYPVTVWDNKNKWKKAWWQTVERKWSFVPGMLCHVTEYRVKRK